MSLTIIDGEYVFVGISTPTEYIIKELPHQWHTRMLDWVCYHNTPITNNNKYEAALWITESIKYDQPKPSDVLKYIEEQIK